MGQPSWPQDLHQEAFQADGLLCPWFHTTHPHHPVLPWSLCTDSRSSSLRDCECLEGRAGVSSSLSSSLTQPNTGHQAGAE